MRTVLPRPGEVAQRLAHGDDARRVEAVGGLIEQQQVRIGKHRRGDAQPLLHAQRVRLDGILGPAAHADVLEHLVERARQLAARPRRAPAGSRGPTGTGRRTASRSANRHGRGASGRAMYTAVPNSAMVPASVAGASEQPQGRCLATAVGTEKAVDPAAWHGHVQPAQRLVLAVALDQATRRDGQVGSIGGGVSAVAGSAGSAVTRRFRLGPTL